MSEGDVLEQKIVDEFPVIEVDKPILTHHPDDDCGNGEEDCEDDAGDVSGAIDKVVDIFLDLEEKAKELFEEYDFDGSGSLDSKELEKVLQHLGLSPDKETVLEYIELYDKNHDGVISLEEFMKIVKDESIMEEEFCNQKNIVAAFRMFDEDGNGFISEEEFKKALMEGEGMDEEEVEDLMAEVDVDEDGQLNYEEFVEFLYGEYGGRSDDDDESCGGDGDGGEPDNEEVEE